MATVIKSDNKELTDKIVTELKTVYDPEIPVNIYELGLIYEIDIKDENKAFVLMTLTAPTCPIAGELVAEVKEKVAKTEGIEDAEVELTFEPPWDMSMMSLEAKLELGFM